MHRILTHDEQTRPLRKWSEDLSINYSTLLARLNNGWSVERTLNPECKRQVNTHSAVRLRTLLTPVAQAHGNRKHGFTDTKEYRAWLAMKARCSDNRRHNAHRYVGRGITVCERWDNSFESFLKDVGPAPTPKHSLGRINNDKNYQPGNCRWETPKQQAANRSTSR